MYFIGQNRWQMAGWRTYSKVGDRKGSENKSNMGASENRGVSTQIIHFNKVFHYKPSILGYPYFWKHPYVETVSSTFVITV